MKIHIKITVVILSCLIFVSCSNEKVEIPDQTLTTYKEILNVSYGNDSEQVYDIYLPENRNFDTKVVILVHGGGWISGDKSDMNNLKDMYRQDFPELAIVSLNYRLANQNNPPFPMQLDDITAAINHLKSKKGEYIISDNLGFVGTSAGGHLSLLWSYAYDLDSNIKMVCSIVGPTNFTDPAYINNNDNIELQLLLGINGINLSFNFLENISPLHKASTSSPPTILFYGGQDPLVPVTQGSDLRDKLITVGVINEFILYQNEGHGWTGDEMLDTWNRLKSFTSEHL